MDPVLEDFACLMGSFEKEVSAEDPSDLELFLQRLHDFGQLKEIVKEATEETKHVTRKLHRITLLLTERLEVQWRGSGSEICSCLLEVLGQLISFLPRSLLGSVSETAAEKRPSSAFVIELDDADALEPIGAKLLLTVILFLHIPSSRSIVHLLTEHPECETSETDGASCVLRFLEDIRQQQMSFWRAFQRTLSDTTEMTLSPASSQQRLLEAERLSGVFALFLMRELPDCVVDRLLPCVLFVLDDFDSDVACVGVHSLRSILSRASERCLRNWKEVLVKSVSDRLLSSDVALWTVLLPVALTLAQKLETVREGRLPCGVTLMGNMVERLLTDSPPFELGDVFLTHGPSIVEHVGRPVVRFFSKLFPLLSQWLFSSDLSFQLKALDLLLSVIRVTPQRIGRHQGIIEEILAALENNQPMNIRGKELMTKIQQTRECLLRVTADCFSEEKEDAIPGQR